MMESKKEVSTQTLLLFSSIFLMLAFLIIQPVDITGLAISLTLFGEVDFSNTTTLIGAGFLLVIIWILIVVLYKRLKHKSKLEKIPGLPGMPDPVSTIEIPTVQEIQKRQGLTEEELKQLFREIAPKIEPQVQQQSNIPMINQKELDFFEQQQKKLQDHLTQDVKNLGQPDLTIPKQIEIQQKKIDKPELELDKKQDLVELKKLIINLLNKNYTKTSIIKYLQKKGWKSSQISQVVKDVNQTNLKNYVKEAISLGYKKEQIVKQLSTKGWVMQEINEILKLPPKKLSIPSKA